jgi:2-methylisocitrate lyase-like PEP mutase family enzyme
LSRQLEHAERFRSLHIPGNPLVLYNAWDAGSAVAVSRSGAKAIATGSWSVAAAQGWADGEEMPLDDTLAVVARIVRCVDLPITVDFEGGHAADPATVSDNVRRLLDLGVVGLNFEDQVVGGSGLYGIDEQMERIRAVRRAAETCGIPAFINARTDVFLKAGPDTDQAGLLDEVLARGAAYAEAGADGFFVPGLKDRPLIRQICEKITLSVNIMMNGGADDVREFASLGVARLSFGPAPYRRVLADIESRAAELLV